MFYFLFIQEGWLWRRFLENLQRTQEISTAVLRASIRRKYHSSVMHFTQFILSRNYLLLNKLGYLYPPDKRLICGFSPILLLKVLDRSGGKRPSKGHTSLCVLISLFYPRQMWTFSFIFTRELWKKDPSQPSSLQIIFLHKCRLQNRAPIASKHTLTSTERVPVSVLFHSI